jgi:hypothetical protein
MKQIKVLVGTLMLVLAAGTASAANSGGLEGALRQVVEKNLAAYNAEDVSGTLASIHTKSPAYGETRDALPRQFSALDARTKLEGFRYIGQDDEFALARVQYRTEGTTTKPFMNNILDTITVFHQEDDTWKYWDNHILGVRLVQ